MTDIPDNQRPVVRHRGEAPTGRPPTPAEDAAREVPTLTRPARKVHAVEYDIPASVRDPDRDPARVTVRELSAEEMVAAVKMGRGHRGGEDDLVKMALLEVDGVTVDHSVAEADSYWGRWSPRVQALLRAAWTRAHTTTAEEDQTFFASGRPKVVAR